MDANDIALIIDNDQGTYEWAYERCVSALENSPDINVLADKDTRKNRGHEYYEVIGDEIREMVVEILGHGELVPGSVQERMISQTINNVDWREVGEHYYQTTVERWEHENES
jgi:hypothetical protein